jgi:putative Holliday junction resolvase
LKRIAGLDVGNRRIGIAVSDPLGLTAQPLCVISRSRLTQDIREVLDALAPYGVERFVVGLPVQLDGREGKQAALVRGFGDALEKATGIPIVYQDERFTTIESERVLVDAGVSRVRRRTVVDKLAAVLILQSYLDGSKPPSPSGGHA